MSKRQGWCSCPISVRPRRGAPRKRPFGSHSACITQALNREVSATAMSPAWRTQVAASAVGLRPQYDCHRRRSARQRRRERQWRRSCAGGAGGNRSGEHGGGDRKSGGEGKSVSVRVDLGGGRINKKKKATEINMKD